MRKGKLDILMTMKKRIIAIKARFEWTILGTQIIYLLLRLIRSC